jgi:HEAT repeat protein
MGTSLDDFLTDELSSERVAEVVQSKALDPVALIERYLFDGRTFLRRNAAAALAQLGVVEAENLHWIVVATKDGDPLVREYATTALPVIGLDPPTAFAALLNALGDREAAVAEAAGVALEQLILNDPEDMADLLVPRLTDGRPMVAATAQELLLRVAEHAGPRLVASCASDDRSLAVAAAATLDRLGTSAQDAIIAGLATVQGRALLLRLLAGLPAASGDARKALEAHSKSEDDPLLATATLRLLAKPPAPEPLGPVVVPSDDFTDALQDTKTLAALAQAKPDVSSLLRGLGDARPVLRANCAALLGRLPAGEGTVTAVAALIRDEDPAVRAATATALGPLGGAVPLLVALEDADEQVRAAAAKALTTLPDEAIAPLAAAAGAASVAAQSAVLFGLASLGADAVAGLRATLTEAPVIPSRAFAAVALGGLASAHAAAVSALVEGLSDESGAVQTAAALGLVRLGTDAPAPVRQAVRDAFGDTTHDAVLRACSRALDAFAGREPPPLAYEPAALPMDGFDTDTLDDDVLEGAAKDLDAAALDGLLMDGRVLVRANAARALAHLGDAAEVAVDGLTLCLKDADKGVRLAAALTLGQLALAPNQVIPALVASRDGASADLAEALDAAFLAYGAAAIAPLVSFVGARASGEEVVFSALVSLGAPAAKALVSLLSSDALSVRVAAARGLGCFGQGAGKASRAALAKAFAAADEPEVMRACSAALDAIDGKVPPPVVEAVRALPVDGFDAEVLDDAVLEKAAPKMDVVRLGELLFDGRKPCRVNAARALGHAGKGAEAFVGALTVALKDSEPDVRVAAAEALGALKSAAAVVVPGLAAAAGRDRSDAVQDAAFAALDAYGKDAVGSILDLLEAEARYASVVGAVATRAPKIYLKPLATALAERESPRAQENAALAIGRLGPAGAGAEPALLAAMALSDVPLKCIVIRALGDVAKPSDALVEALKVAAIEDERESVEGAVADALRALKRR